MTLAMTLAMTGANLRSHPAPDVSLGMGLQT
jgi:hypothetical protein